MRRRLESLWYESSSALQLHFKEIMIANILSVINAFAGKKALKKKNSPCDIRQLESIRERKG